MNVGTGQSCSRMSLSRFGDKAAAAAFGNKFKTETALEATGTARALELIGFILANCSPVGRDLLNRSAEQRGPLSPSRASCLAPLARGPVRFRAALVARR